ncbi:MAG TPA: phosphate ABC transporter substrate-binding protein PstS [Egibacteraceae bacterium]|jgi:phosphate transport system substrate-binding protein|nr:phosphate ABC transporter substrate-binding protein PstS [Egibacteraceae bacterium]
MRTWRMAIATALSASVLAACGGNGGALPAAPGDVADRTGDETAGNRGELSGALVGAGATFPTPVFQDWILAYGESVQPGASINYQSIGSGGGIEQFIGQTVDFGSSERFLDDDGVAEAAAARGCDPLQVPVLFGAVTIAYNAAVGLEGLVLDAATISGIFRREITRWDDPAIAEINPGLDLPDTDIIPVHRSDGSGTTSVFTTWLQDEDPAWAEELGSGTEVNWPAGTIGGQGNEGVTAGIEQNPGGIGYVNQAYALENDLPTAAVVNADGNPIEPTLDATTAAVEGIDVPDDFRFHILGVGDDGYPITGTNWVFAWECGYDAGTAALLRDFWTWATQTAQADELAVELGYAPLGESLKPRVLETIERINAEDE